MAYKINTYMHVGEGPIITRGLNHTANQDAVAKSSVLISMLCPVSKSLLPICLNVVCPYSATQNDMVKLQNKALAHGTTPSRDKLKLISGKQ